MVNIEYANAYTEVLEIIKYISIEDYNKIPKNKIELFKSNNNREYKFEYNPHKTLDEQNVSKIAKTLIAILYRDYWATPEQREKIIAKEKQDMQSIEKESRDRYNPDNMFKNKKDDKSINNEDIIEVENLPEEIKKQSFLKKIINFITNIFKH